MTAVMAQCCHEKQEAQIWEQGINRTLVIRTLVTRILMIRRLVIRTLMIRRLGKGSLLNSSDRAPEEACELDVPASNVAVVEGNMQLGIQLSCLQQADVGRQNCGCDVAPMASDGCCVCIWHAHTHTHTHTLQQPYPLIEAAARGACARQTVGALTEHLGLGLWWLVGMRRCDAA